MLHVLEGANAVLWGPAMLVVLFATGVYLGAKTHLCIYKPRLLWRATLGHAWHGTGKGAHISPFAALCTALAATLGTGNIAGVALAIAMGGPGAAFWMFVAALCTAGTKYAEAALAVRYRSAGMLGPIDYILGGAKKPALAWLYAALAVVGALTSGSMVQSNTLAAAAGVLTGLPPWVMGLCAAVLAAVVLLGGIRRIAHFATLMVPAMAVVYCLGALLVVAANASAVPTVLALMVRNALTPAAACGAFAGCTVRYSMSLGVARGIFSTEAGMGSAAFAHAAAGNTNPQRQGMWGALEVFIDAGVSLMTSVAVLCSGAWCEGLNGIQLTMAAFSRALTRIGAPLVGICTVCFAFTSIISWAYYGTSCAGYLFGARYTRAYTGVYVLCILLGAILSLPLVWELSGVLCALMIIPNLIALWLLRRDIHPYSIAADR